MGLVGILVGLGLLIWLAFRGWSVLLLAPVAALVAALFGGQPLLASWTQIFMGSAAGFLAQFFPLFLLGAVFGKLMDDSRSVSAVADYMTNTLGRGRVLLAVVLAGAVVTYGGVSLFVAFFVLAPMAQELFRAAAVPSRLMPAAIILGSSTFTMSALPGTPSIQNAIPMPFFGTTPFAAPGLGVLASIIMLGFGLWWLARAENAARQRGEGFGGETPVQVDAAADDELVRERATTAREFDPAEMHRGHHSDALPSAVVAALPLIVVILVNLLMSLFVLPRLDFSFLAEKHWGGHLDFGGGWRVVGCRRARGRDCDRHTCQPEPPARTPQKHGCRRQCIRSAGTQRREPRRLRCRGRGVASLRHRPRLGVVYRGRSTRVPSGRNKCACCVDRLGLRRVDDRVGRSRGDIYDDRLTDRP